MARLLFREAEFSPRHNQVMVVYQSTSLMTGLKYAFTLGTVLWFLLNIWQFLARPTDFSKDSLPSWVCPLMRNHLHCFPTCKEEKGQETTVLLFL